MVEHVPVIGRSTIKYNHYEQSFKHVDGLLKWSDLDSEYYLSYAFPGKCKPTLRPEVYSHYNAKEDKIEGYLDDSHFLKYTNECFIGLEVGKTYILKVEADPEHEKEMIEKEKKSFL